MHVVLRFSIFSGCSFKAFGFFAMEFSFLPVSFEERLQKRVVIRVLVSEMSVCRKEGSRRQHQVYARN